MPTNRPTRARWNVLALIVGLSFIAYVLRTNMSVAGDAMMRDLGLTQVQLGMILAAFAWAYGLFQFPGGIIGDRFGARRALAWIAVGWGVANLLTGLAPGTAVLPSGAVLLGLIAVRFVMGMVQAPLFPVMAGAIRHWYPPAGWALPNALSNTGLTLGGAATGPLIVWLVATAGWRMSFVVTAPLALVAACGWWWYYRDHPRDHPGVGREELVFIAGGRTDDDPAERGAGHWMVVLRDRNVLLLTVSYFCQNYVFYIFFNWFFIYLVQVREFAAIESGWLSTAPWLTGALFATVGGVWCDRLCRTRGMRQGCRIPAIVGLLTAAVLLFAGATAKDPYMAVLFLSLCFGAQQFTDSSYWAAVISVGGSQASAAAGVLNTAGNVVGGVGALLVPITAETFGWIPALATGSVFALVGAALWLFIRADAPITASA